MQEPLRNRDTCVFENLRKNDKIDHSHIDVSVKNSAVTMKRSVKTYQESGLAGQAAGIRQECQRF